MNAIVMRPVSWSDMSDISDVEQVCDDDYACIDEVLAVLKKHGRAERLGICLLHKHLDPSEDEVLIERADYANRRLITEPIKRDDPRLVGSWETSWSLHQGGAFAARRCETYCKDNSGEWHSTHNVKHRRR